MLFVSSDAVCGCLGGGMFVEGLASRSASLLLMFGGVWVDVKFGFVLRVRRVGACVVGGSFRASHLGQLRCF